MHIHNGDHADFEIKHANIPLEERPDWPLPSFDATDWAKAFCKRVSLDQIDEDLIRAWFASALMRGYDEGRASTNTGSRAMSEEILRRAIVEIAEAILLKEYGKDLRNEKLIRLLAENAWDEFAIATAHLSARDFPNE